MASRVLMPAIGIAPRGVGGLIARSVLLFGMVTIVLGIATYGVVHETIEAQLDERIAAEAGVLLAAGQAAGYRGVAAAVAAREARHSAGDLGYIVLDPARRRIAGTLRAQTPPDGYFEFLGYDHADGTRGVAQALNQPIAGGGRLIVAADRGPVDAMDRILLALFAGAFGLLLLLGLTGAIFVGRMVRRRLGHIADTADAIMAGDFSRRMPVTAAMNDFDRLSSVINRMLDRIEILLDNLRRVSADVAHDIRTPLHRLRGRIETAETAVRSDEARVALAAATRDIDDLLEMIDGLLAISEIEGSAVRKRFAPLALAALVEDVIDGYRPAIEAASMRIGYAAQPGRIAGDAALLRRCVANLLDNVILHTPPGTAIRVAIAATGAELVLTVADDGPGVPEVERARIFDRFVRLDASRSRPGHGLGLNLVAAIAHAHRGSARAAAATRGLTIELRLPRA